jgi:hypothetical protein
MTTVMRPRKGKKSQTERSRSSRPSSRRLPTESSVAFPGSRSRDGAEKHLRPAGVRNGHRARAPFDLSHFFLHLLFCSAIHSVPQWAGKTIALGTFPAAEADEKCARAKALTRAWRSTMRPKPTRDWVMTELERLGVRVVSGRLGRKAGEEGEEGDKKGSAAPAPTTSAGVSGGDPSVERSNSIGWGADADLAMMAGGARRSSSLGLSMMDPGRRGSLGSLGPVVGMEGGDPNMPPHRPLAGGAYEASHYSGKGADGAQRRASSLGLGTLGGGLGNMGMSVNPNQ